MSSKSLNSIQWHPTILVHFRSLFLLAKAVVLTYVIYSGNLSILEESTAPYIASKLSTVHNPVDNPWPIPDQLNAQASFKALRSDVEGNPTFLRTLANTTIAMLAYISKEVC
jgi:hypothetical protein